MSELCLFCNKQEDNGIAILHLLKGFDAEGGQTLFQHFGGQVAENEAAFAGGTFALQNGAVLEEGRKFAGKFKQIIAQKIRAAVVSGRFKRLAEIQQMLGKCDFFRR